MRMVDPEKCFRLYIAIKAHFTTDSYDALKYNARVKTSGLENRKDADLFRYIGNRFNDSKEVATYYIANFARGNEYPIDDVDRGTEYLKVWQKNRQSLRKVFKDDVDTLLNTDLCYNDLVDATNIPKMYLMMRNNEVTVETLAILNQFSNFTDQWKKKQPLFAPEFRRIHKLASFIKFDRQIYLSNCNSLLPV